MCPSRPSGSPASSGGHLLFTLPARCTLAVSGRPSAPWPGVPPPQSPHRAGPCPPQSPGASSTPGAPPLRSSRRGQAAAARVGTLCASAGRWGTPAGACCTARRVRPPFGPLAWRLPRSPLNVLVPPLTAAAFPLAHAQGWVCPCVLMHVSSARLSPCGWTCVSGCGHVCVCQSSLFCCPPAVFVSSRARPVEDPPLLHGSARLLACFCLS